MYICIKKIKGYQYKIIALKHKVFFKVFFKNIILYVVYIIYCNQIIHIKCYKNDMILLILDIKCNV